MPRILNTFTPNTDIGQALQALTVAMFSGPSPDQRAEKEARAAERAQHAALYGAQTRKAEQEAAAAEQAAAELANFLPTFVTSRAGITRPQFEAFQGFQSTGAFPESYDAGWLTPDVRARIADAIAAASAYTADQRDRNPDQLGKLIGALQNAGLTDRALAGTIDRPTTERLGAVRGAIEGKPAYSELTGNVTGAVSRYFGDVSVPRNQVNDAIVATEQARAGELGARARLSGEKATTEAERRKLLGAQASLADARASGGGKPPKPRSLKPEDLAKAIRTLLEVNTDRTGQPSPGSRPPLAGQDMTDLMDLAQRLYSAPGSAIAEGNAAGAIMEAIRQLTGATSGFTTQESEVVKPGFLGFGGEKKNVQKLKRQGGAKVERNTSSPAKGGGGIVVRNWNEGS